MKPLLEILEEYIIATELYRVMKHDEHACNYRYDSRMKGMYDNHVRQFNYDEMQAIHVRFVHAERDIKKLTAYDIEEYRNVHKENHNDSLEGKC